MAKIISYERRVHESVDDNTLSYAISQKPTKKESMQQRGKCNYASVYCNQILLHYEQFNINNTNAK